MESGGIPTKPLFCGFFQSAFKDAGFFAEKNRSEGAYFY
jgi:hypothetical protein